MRIVYTLVFIFTVMLNSIELSSQFECLPNGAPIAGVPRGDLNFSSSDKKHPPASSVPPARSRSRSPSASHTAPPTQLSFTNIIGYGLDQLPFIRLIANKNPNRQLVLRRYTFPVDKPIQILAGRKVFQPMPTEEQIVLSTYDSDVFAIVDSANVLAGIYKYNPRIKCKARAKINMESGTITSLTPEEIEEVPVGALRPILDNFRVEHVNHSDGQHPPASSLPPARPRARSPPASYKAPPTRLPLSNVLGYGLDQLPFIRLCSIGNPHRLFELRRYIFPADKRMKIPAGRHRFMPMPTQEQIVLSTFHGDVFAILESSDVLFGIYVYSPRLQHEGRSKINMKSGTITLLTPDEIKETPVGSHRSIFSGFIVTCL